LKANPLRLPIPILFWYTGAGGVNPNLSLLITFSHVFINFINVDDHYCLGELLQQVTPNLLRKGLNIGLVLRLFGDEM